MRTFCFFLSIKIIFLYRGYYDNDLITRYADSNAEAALNNGPWSRRYGEVYE